MFSQPLLAQQVKSSLPGHAKYFYVLPFSILILLAGSIPVVSCTVSMYFQLEWKTVWILIRWLHQKPADLNGQCFQKRIYPGSAGGGRGGGGGKFSAQFPLEFRLLFFPNLKKNPNLQRKQFGVIFIQSTHTLVSYIVTFYYHCILFLLQFNGNSICNS